MRVIGQRWQRSRPLRWAFRAPVYLYRARLGWLLGGKFLLLEHTGRRTGLIRRTVVEVVAREPGSGGYVVASGFGPGADWYRNLRAHPHATITVGRRRAPVTATEVPAEDAAGVMVDYAHRHPHAAPRLCRFMGFAVDGSDADYAAVGRRLSLLRLTPIHTGATGTDQQIPEVSS